MYPKVVAPPVRINLKNVILGAAKKNVDCPVPKVLNGAVCCEFIAGVKVYSFFRFSGGLERIEKRFICRLANFIIKARDPG